MHARYDYDPWGRRITVSGDLDPDVGFTGHYQHTPSGLGLAPFRASDPNVGRWINEDPSGLAGGPNRFAYVDGNPVTMYDPTGDDGELALAGGVAAGLTAGFTAPAWVLPGRSWRRTSRGRCDCGGPPQPVHEEQEGPGRRDEAGKI
jgi:RHS repeat-associated protein